MRPEAAESHPWHDEGDTPGEVTTADVPMRKAKEKEIGDLRNDLAAAEQALADPGLDAQRRARAERERTILYDRLREAEEELSTMPLGYLDLTALGELVGLQRIRSFVNKVKPTGQDWGLAAESVSTSKAAVLVDKLEALQTAHGTLSIELDGRSVPLGAFDVALMRRYLTAAASRAACNKTGFCISATLTMANKKAATELQGLLEDLRDVAFLRPDDQKVATGAYWAKQVEAVLSPPAEQAPVNQTDGKTASKNKTAKAWSLAVVPVVGRLPEPAVSPVAGAPESTAPAGAGAETGATPPAESIATAETPRPLSPQELVLLPGKVLFLPCDGAPIGMEWWHFQRNDVVDDGTFGDNLAAIGWSRECLEERNETLYWRAGVGYPAKDLGGKQ